MTKALDEYQSPPRKILAMLHTAREKLRQKYTEVRRQLRTAENQVRAVEKSRAAWRKRAEDAERELAEFKKKSLATGSPAR